MPLSITQKKQGANTTPKEGFLSFSFSFSSDLEFL